MSTSPRPSSSASGSGAALAPVAPPVLYVNHGTVTIPADLPAEWYDLRESQAKINATLASVGCIQYKSLLLGTGFLVARNIVLTARHVAESFTTNIDGVAKIRFDWTPQIDFDGEHPPGHHGEAESPAPSTSRSTSAAADEAPDDGHGHADEHEHDSEHATCGCADLQSVIYMHEHLDLALIRVTFPEKKMPANWRRPQPMTLSTAMPAPDSGSDPRPKVYLIGFPREDPTAMPQDQKKAFGAVLGVKRVQPGHITNDPLPTAGREFTHDASTLKGNSGSCVVDLQTHRVIGLHLQGSRERQGQEGFNRAIAFWLLSEEDKAPLRRAGIDLA